MWLSCIHFGVLLNAGGKLDWQSLKYLKEELTQISLALSVEKDYNTNSFKNHMTIHTEEKPYSYDQCGNSYRLASSYKSHLHSHSREKPFNCNQCGNFFFFKSLKSHLKIHTKLKPLLFFVWNEFFHGLSLWNYTRKVSGVKDCMGFVCGKPFITDGELRHNQRIQTGEKPYKCSRYDKRFSESGHERIHTEEKLHVFFVWEKFYMAARF